MSTTYGCVLSYTVKPMSGQNTSFQVYKNEEFLPMSFLRKFSEGYGEGTTKIPIEKEDNVGPKTKLEKHWEGNEEKFKDISGGGELMGKKGLCWGRNTKYCRKKKSCDTST